MNNFGRALVYSTAALGLLAFGACSNSSDGNPVTYGGASGAGNPGGAAGSVGGVGAIGGQGGLGGLGAQGGASGAGGGGGTGPQPNLIDKCPGSLDPAAAQALKNGGAPGSMRWLYPYDKTVFPRGILPPAARALNPSPLRCAC